MGEAGAIATAIGSAINGVFGWLGKSTDLKIVQEGSNSAYQNAILSAEIENQRIEQQRTNRIMGVAAIIIVVTIVAVIIITVKKRK